MSQEELEAVKEEAAPETAEAADVAEPTNEAAPAEVAAPAEAAAPAEEKPATRVERSRNPDRRHADGVPAIIRRRRPFGRRKVCRFCVDPSLPIDFRDPQLLKYFVTERGKIIPRRISGNCAKHQRQIARSIKRARVLGLMPFTVVTS